MATEAKFKRHVVTKKSRNVHTFASKLVVGTNMVCGLQLGKRIYLVGPLGGT